MKLSLLTGRFVLARRTRLPASERPSVRRTDGQTRSRCLGVPSLRAAGKGGFSIFFFCPSFRPSGAAKTEIVKKFQTCRKWRWFSDLHNPFGLGIDMYVHGEICPKDLLAELAEPLLFPTCQANRLRFPTCILFSLDLLFQTCSFSASAFRLADRAIFSDLPEGFCLSQTCACSPLLSLVQAAGPFFRGLPPSRFPCRLFVFQTCRSRLLFRPAKKASPFQTCRLFRLVFQTCRSRFLLIQTCACSPPLSGARLASRPPR